MNKIDQQTRKSHEYMEPTGSLQRGEGLDNWMEEGGGIKQKK